MKNGTIFSSNTIGEKRMKKAKMRKWRRSYRQRGYERLRHGNGVYSECEVGRGGRKQPACKGEQGEVKFSGASKIRSVQAKKRTRHEAHNVASAETTYLSSDERTTRASKQCYNRV